MRILGIDPGLRVTGFGVVEKYANDIRYVTSGCVKTSGRSLPDRIKTILLELNQIIRQQMPYEVVIEKVFVNNNPQSTLSLGQARGAAICAAVMESIPVSEYTALQIKQSVVGNGHASKEQVQEMVKRLLSLSRAPNTDASDALACAICHVHHSFNSATVGHIK